MIFIYFDLELQLSSAAPIGTTLSELQEAVATGEAGDALAVSTAVGLKVREPKVMGGSAVTPVSP